MVLTAMAFELGQEDGRSSHEPSRAGHNEYSDRECWARERGSGADYRPGKCVRLSGRFLATVAVPVRDPRGMGAMHLLQTLKARLEGAATLVREFY